MFHLVISKQICFWLSIMFSCYASVHYWNWALYTESVISVRTHSFSLILEMYLPRVNIVLRTYTETQMHFSHRDVFVVSPSCKGEHGSEFVTPQTSLGSLADSFRSKEYITEYFRFIQKTKIHWFNLHIQKVKYFGMIRLAERGKERRGFFFDM